MAFKVQKAEKKRAKLRLALDGPSGAGKTWTALAIASGIGKRVAVIDTERDSACLYANDFDFDSGNLDSFSPLTYVDAIRSLEKDYDVIVIDSLSHAWFGKDGALEQVDMAQKRQKTANSYTAWRDVTPMHNALVDAMLQCRAHVIATIRTKTEYVQEKNDNGKTVIRRVGLAPVQREGMEYEFTMVCDLDIDHVLTVSKTRCSLFDGAVIRKPGREVGEKLLAWLNDGAEEAPKPEPIVVKPAPKPAAPVPAQATIATAPDLLAEVENTDASIALAAIRELDAASDMPAVVAVWKTYAPQLTKDGKDSLQAACAARKAQLSSEAA